MLHKIVDELVPQLSFSFQEIIAGISVPTKKNINNTEKTFPVYYKDTLAVCETDNLQQLVPDSTKKSIIYFEVINQPTVEATHKAFNEFTATIRLVCWVNYKLINGDLHDVSVIASNILDGMPTKLSNVDFISSIRLYFNSQVDKSTLFTNFTYNEAERQFMTYPYDAFGLDYDLTFRIARGCSDTILIDPSC